MTVDTRTGATEHPNGPRTTDHGFSLHLRRFQPTCRTAANGAHHAMPGIAHLHNLTLTG